MGAIRRISPPGQTDGNLLSLLALPVVYAPRCAPSHANGHPSFSPRDLPSLLQWRHHHAWRRLRNQRSMGPESRPTRPPHASSANSAWCHISIQSARLYRQPALCRPRDSPTIPNAVPLVRNPESGVCSELPAHETHHILSAACLGINFFLGSHHGFPSPRRRLAAE